MAGSMPFASDIISQQLELADALLSGMSRMLEPQDLPGRYGRVVRALDQVLNACDCESVVSGGWAVWRHGYLGRVTQVVDIAIPKANIDEFLTSEVPEIQRFLGQGENAIGSLFGIANDFMVPVIRQVGNYGEIYDRNLGPDTPFNLPRGVNGLWTDGGLLYSPPFR